MMRRAFIQLLGLSGVDVTTENPHGPGVCSCGAKMRDMGCLVTAADSESGYYAPTSGSYPGIRVWWCETCGNLRAWKTEAKR